MGRDSSGVSRHIPATWPRLQHMHSTCIQACQRTLTHSKRFARPGAARTHDGLQRATASCRLCDGVQSVAPQSPTGRCWDPTGWVRIAGVYGWCSRWQLPLHACRTPSSQRAGPETLARPTTDHGPVDPRALTPLCFPGWRQTLEDPARAPVRWTGPSKPHRRPLLIPRGWGGGLGNRSFSP